MDRGARALDLILKTGEEWRMLQRGLGIIESFLLGERELTECGGRTGELNRFEELVNARGKYAYASLFFFWN